jgi:hypothetical protein
LAQEGAITQAQVQELLGDPNLEQNLAAADADIEAELQRLIAAETGG